MNTKNLQEYYGRLSWPDNSVNSEAYLTMLVSFDYATKIIQFHFNMKEPARPGNSLLAESDF